MRRLALLLAALAACGREVPRGGIPAEALGPRVIHELGPADLMPEDLDLVVRINLARMKSSLGAPMIADLAKTALRDTSDDPLRQLLVCADVAWVGLRAQDFASGDRVVVVEGKKCSPSLEPGAWTTKTSPRNGVTLLERASPPPRDGIAAVVKLGDRATALVSPVEMDPVMRILTEGADTKRADPSAEGTVSADLKNRGIAPSLALRFPSLAAILRGVERVRATATLQEDGLRIEGDIACRNDGAATKARKFLEALRDNATDTGSSAALKSLGIDQVERDVRVKWIVPPAIVRAMIEGTGEPPKAEPPAPP